MSNKYLEKIALSVEDTRAARKSGEKAGDKVVRKYGIIGAGVGAGVGAAAGYNFGGNLLTPKKTRVLIAAGGALFGAANGYGYGGMAAAPAAEKAKVTAHTKSLNHHLSKSAAVTEAQVRQRSARNEVLAGLGGIGGFVGGAGVGLAGVGAYGLHKGMKNSGAYEALKNSITNSRIRKKTQRDLGNGATLMGKAQSVAKYTGNGENMARAVGHNFGTQLKKKGLLGLTAGGLIGGAIARRAVQKKTDVSDVDHYSALHRKNKSHE